MKLFEGTKFRENGQKSRKSQNLVPAKFNTFKGKYEYLTGEETLSSNQSQITKQAEFAYSRLGKAFEKQIKTIKDQGAKKADALESLKSKELKPKEAKPIEYDNYFINGLAEIRNSTKTIDFANLSDNFKGLNIAPINFMEFKGPLHFFASIYDGDKSLEDVEKGQIKLKSELGRIEQGIPKDKLEEQF